MLTEEERNTIISALRERQQKYAANMDERRLVLLRTAHVLSSAAQIDTLCRRMTEAVLQCTPTTEGG